MFLLLYLKFIFLVSSQKHLRDDVAKKNMLKTSFLYEAGEILRLHGGILKGFTLRFTRIKSAA